MRKILLAAAISISSAALAQTATDDTQPTTTDETSTTDQTMGTDQGTGTTGTTATTTTTTTTTGTTGTADMQTTSQGGMGGMTVAPGNNNPERDARGIPVVSDPATAPAGTNMGAAGAGAVPSGNQGAAFATQASTENYPACSRTVTDNCVQTYERGSRR